MNGGGEPRVSYRPRRRQQIYPVALTAAATGGLWLGIVNDSRKSSILVALLPVAVLLVAYLTFRLLDPRPLASLDDSRVRFQTGSGLGATRTYGWDQIRRISRVEPRTVSLNRMWGMKAVPEWVERRQARRAGAAFVVTTSDHREHIVWSAGPDPGLADFRSELQRRSNRHPR